MKIVSLTVGPIETNCYVVVDERSGSCMVIDPGGDAGVILDALRKEEANVGKIVLTHAHFDHTGAVAELKEKTGAEVLVGRGDAGLLENPDWMRPRMNPKNAAGIRPDGVLNESDLVKVGELFFKVLETPGHTPGSICLYREGTLFSGDTLFLEGVGRTDLPGGSMTDLRDSIAGKLFLLPDDTVVYPGHGETTTIGHEKMHNPFV